MALSISSRIAAFVLTAALFGCSEVPTRGVLPTVSQEQPPLPQPIEPILPAAMQAPSSQPTSSTRTNDEASVPALKRTGAKANPSLLGRHYLRAFVPPRMVFNGWAVTMRLDLGKDADRDFFLLGRKEQRVAVIATRDRKISGMTYRFSVSAEQPVPDQYQAAPVVLCRGPYSSQPNIIAALSNEQQPSPVWAVQEDSSKGLRLLGASELDSLRCAKPRSKTKPKRRGNHANSHRWV